MNLEPIAVTDRKMTNAIREALNEHHERLEKQLRDSRPMPIQELSDALPRFINALKSNRCVQVSISSIDKIFEKDEKSRIVAFAEIETSLPPSQAMSLLRKKLNEVNAGLGMEVLGIKFDVKESNGIN